MLPCCPRQIHAFLPRRAFFITLLQFDYRPGAYFIGWTDCLSNVVVVPNILLMLRRELTMHTAVYPQEHSIQIPLDFPGLDLDDYQVLLDESPVIVVIVCVLYLVYTDVDIGGRARMREHYDSLSSRSSRSRLARLGYGCFE